MNLTVPKAAYSYIRVSTLLQAEEGVSLDAQRERIIDYCTRNNFFIAGSYADEGLSAKRADNRPALQQALKEVCENKGILVVYSLSRLCRSTRDALDIAERLKRAGAHLVSITEQIDTTCALGEFFFTVMAALAQLERRLIGERTKEALRHKRANGEKCGGHVPYGYTLVDGKLVANPVEQIAIDNITQWRNGLVSFPVIAKRLNNAAQPTRTGVPWSAKVVRDVYMRTQPR